MREYGDAYRAVYGEQVLPSQRDALWDIAHCRTAVMGGEVYWCDACQHPVYSYHSCGNRHCPKCGGDRADAWRDRQLDRLLPVPYFLVTFTLPHTLNGIAYAHQKLIYDLLFTTSTETLSTLAMEPDWIGGTIGTIGALHTWSRSMAYHVHVHYLVPGGGLDPVTGLWRPSAPAFLVPVAAVRDVFRAKFRDALHGVDPTVFAQVPPATWAKDWGVHCKAVGNGETALKYLTPYLYRVALSNRRLVSLKDGNVTFRYTPQGQGWKTMTLDAIVFLHRFVQHVLPKGFHKIRYSGFLHPNAGHTLAALQAQFRECDPPVAQLPAELASTFGFDRPETASDDTSVSGAAAFMTDTLSAEKPVSETLGPETPPPPVTADSPTDAASPDERPRTCPHCGGPLRLLGQLPPPWAKEVRAPP